jgi:hypothetical protein
MGVQREPTRADAIRRAFHWSGIAWWTPLVGKQDSADLEYLRASIVRDLEWVSGMVRPAELEVVRKDLAALVGQGTPGESRFQPVVYPWHVPSGWTDYGGIRLALLAVLPVEARLGALVELRNMEGLVLAESRAKWRQAAIDLQAELTAATSAGDASIPHKLQALWREIDFGRNYWRVRVAKNTTITSLTWSLVLAATITLLVMFRAREPDGQINVWLVALLGFLGGSMSALRSTSILSGERRSIEIEAARVRLRPVVGSAMAVVAYVIGQSALVFELVTSEPSTASHHAPIQIYVQNIAWGYYAIAFLAGFTERWFLKILELAEGRFDPPPPSPPPSRPTPAGDAPKPEPTPKKT